MAEQTGISWCDVTMNPWIGCENVSPGCAKCYAHTLAEGRMGLDVWGPDAPRKVTSDGYWRKPLQWNRASAARGRADYGGRPDERIRVFCASMADAFEPRPDLEEPRHRLFRLIEETPELDWLILTKRPEFARDWLREWYTRYWFAFLRDPERHADRDWSTRDGIEGFGVLPNVWIGTSIENARFTWRADVLREIPAAVRFISAEPLLGSLCDAGRGGDRHGPGGSDAPRASSGPDATYPSRRAPLDLDGIDWLIVGGESGGRESRPMHPAWARELRDSALSRRNVALHFKQWGSWVPADPADGGQRRFSDGRPRCWVTPRGARLENGAALVPAGSAFMRYAGAAPKAGGKLLDGVEHCDFPDRRPVAA